MVLGEGICDVLIFVVGFVLIGYVFDCFLGGIRGYVLYGFVFYDFGREFLFGFVKISFRVFVDFVYL